MAVEFVWDAEKAAANQQKHGVSFEEAQTVFMTPMPWLLMTSGIPRMNRVKS
jgi:uncharacterized DUF497 family protein